MLSKCVRRSAESNRFNQVVRASMNTFALSAWDVISVQAEEYRATVRLRLVGILVETRMHS
jgi:hypothetical protein